MNRATAVLTVVLAVPLAGCGGSSTGGDASGSGKTDTIQVAVKDGKVTPATHREPVAKGDTVKLVVTTDTADEVHVHEVETHESGLQLLQLEVR